MSEREQGTFSGFFIARNERVSQAKALGFVRAGRRTQGKSLGFPKGSQPLSAHDFAPAKSSVLCLPSDCCSNPCRRYHWRHGFERQENGAGF